MSLRHEIHRSCVAVDMDLGQGGFNFCLRRLGILLERVDESVDKERGSFDGAVASLARQRVDLLLLATA